MKEFRRQGIEVIREAYSEGYVFSDSTSTFRLAVERLLHTVKGP